MDRTDHAEPAGLALTRRPGEAVVITVPPAAAPTELRVTVVKDRAGRTRLVFDAPREVVIDREEVHQDKLRRRAAGGAA